MTEGRPGAADRTATGNLDLSAAPMSVENSGRRAKHRLAGLSMASRLAAAMVTVSVISLLIVTAIGLRTGRQLGRELDELRLTSLQASGADAVVAYMDSLQRTALALSSSPQAEIALREFADAHTELLNQDDSQGLQEQRRALIDDYRVRYLEPLSATRPNVELRDVMPDNPAATHLQFHYAVDTSSGVEPASVDDADDGSRWSEVHAVAHVVYRNVVDQLDLVDLYLIEPENGYVVYSVRKGPELGTSIGSGPFSGTGLSTVIDKLNTASDDQSVISDFGFYLPAGDTPVGFVASPVIAGDELVGYLVLMYDTEEIDHLLSGGADWDAGGFPPTAQTLLFGGDRRVRSEPRSFVEEPEAYLTASVEAGLSEADRDRITATGTTVLTQVVPATTVALAKADDGSLLEGDGLTGQASLIVARPVVVGDLDWFVLADVEAEAADRGIDEFSVLLLTGVAFLVLLLAFVATGWSRWLVGPIRQISDQLGTESDGPVAIDIPERSPSEFRQLSTSFENMANSIAEQRAHVAATRSERLGLLRRMLPPAVAARVAGGQEPAVDEIAQASVVVVVVAGLGDVVRGDTNGTNKEAMNRLLVDLDDLASRHQLDRVKVVGDAYFAACGHDRPLIDHAPRAVAFAIDARDAIRAIGDDWSGLFDAVIGIDTGQVMAGLTGGGRLVYDVWGEAVSTAHYLARRGRRGAISVSDHTRSLLPESIEVAPARDAGVDQPIWLVAPEPERNMS